MRGASRSRHAAVAALALIAAVLALVALRMRMARQVPS